MAERVIDRAEDQLASPEVIERRKAEIAQILAETIANINPELRDKFFSISVEQKKEKILIEMESPGANMEETLGQLEAAIDSAQGEAEDKIAVKAVLRGVSYLFANIVGNQMDETTFDMLTGIVRKLREILGDGKIDKGEVTDLKAKSVKPNVSSTAVDKMVDKVRSM